jgi:putative transposase
MHGTAQTHTIYQIAEAKNITRQATDKRAKSENWQYIQGSRNSRLYITATLPEDVQTALAEKGQMSIDALPALSPCVALATVEHLAGDVPAYTSGFEVSLYNKSTPDAWTGENVVDMNVIRNPRVIKWSRIVNEAQRVPLGWKCRAWVEDVAKRHNTTASTIYRQISKYDEKGLAGLKHTKGDRKPRAWTPEAVDWWVGLCLKREHRNMAKDALYAILVAKSVEMKWDIGCYNSALWWFEKKVTPQLKAYQRGGLRALDNMLPPVLRDYSDLGPFEILVGDQHRFDFWVTDDEDGSVFRPEGYFWQDLRTRCFYGGAIDKKYDSYLMGMALHMGLKIFGPFGSIYNDNGKPERSRYIMSILKDMRAIGLEVKNEVEADIDIDCNAEEINPLASVPGTQRLAIVKNAKAKMIEGTFNVLEDILIDHFGVPGSVATLGGDIHENDVAWGEIKRLAAAGKLLTYREFVLTVLKAMDYYNSKKAHRGVLKEWKWRPKPKTATPLECLKQCAVDGWKPVMLSQEAIDLVFLPRVNNGRMIDKGRILFQGETYEDKRERCDCSDSRPHLIDLHGKRVELRHDPLDPEWLLVFDDGNYICKAEPVEYSSMINPDLTARKIEEKRRHRKGFILEYRALTSGIPDMLEYSKVSTIEKAAAVIGAERKEQSAKRLEMYRELSPEEMEEGIRKIEDREVGSQKSEVRSQKALKRPGYFLTELDRYKWVIKAENHGDALTPEDSTFRQDYESRMNEDQREYWETVRQYEKKAEAV